MFSPTGENTKRYAFGELKLSERNRYDMLSYSIDKVWKKSNLIPAYKTMIKGIKETSGEMKGRQNGETDTHKV
jgi:hypothetical protein